MATLYHWDLPQVLEDEGGWLNPASPDWFAGYAAVAKEQLGDLFSLWTTINEPWCAAFLGYSVGEHAPGRTEPGEAYVAAHNLILAHHLAIGRMRETNPRPEDRLGIVLNLIPAWPIGDGPEDRAVADAVDVIQNRLFLETALSGTYPEPILAHHQRYGVADLIDYDQMADVCQDSDYLGVNYYNVNWVAHRSKVPSHPHWPGADEVQLSAGDGELTAMGWGVEPKGLTWILERVAREYPDVPLYVCENGAAYRDLVAPDGTVDDPDRIAYLDSHIAAVAAAMETGADVRGYFVWSLLDNFEWAWGYSMRFGLVRVDPETLNRTVKKSGFWYRDLIRSAQG